MRVVGAVASADQIGSSVYNIDISVGLSGQGSLRYGMQRKFSRS